MKRAASTTYRQFRDEIIGPGQLDVDVQGLLGSGDRLEGSCRLRVEFSVNGHRGLSPAHEYGGAADEVDTSVAPNRAELIPCQLVHHDALHIHFVSRHAEREAVDRVQVPKTRKGFYGPQPASVGGNDGVVRRAVTRSARAP